MAQLNRTLSIPMLTFYGTGMIIGAGIYSIIGKAAIPAQETLWISFLFAGFTALLTAFSYAELSTMFPLAGAEYVYLSHSFRKNKWLAETTGLAMAFSGAATASTVAIAFSGYLNQFTQAPSPLVAVSLLILFTGIAIIGVRISGWANIIFTIIEVSGLILIIYLGLQNEKFGEALSAVPHRGTMTGAALIIFSFFGFENIVTLAEETREPEKKLPPAIFLSLAISLILYVLVSLSALALLPPNELAQSESPLMTMAEKGSPLIARALGGIALFSTANTALISMLGASRILYGMAEDKSLPSWLGRVLPKRRTPWIASLVILAMALALLPLTEVEIVASISSLATMFAFLGVNMALIVLRYSEPDRKRPFRVPLHLGRLPILPAFGAFFSFLYLFQFESPVYWVGGGFLIVIAFFFFFRQRCKSW